ncbi:MAG: hypothetical protein RIR62_2584 [Pseudomonadota bacterium]
MSLLVRVIFLLGVGAGLYLAVGPKPQANGAGAAPAVATAPIAPGRLTEESLTLPVVSGRRDYTAPRGVFDTATFSHAGQERRWHWIVPAGKSGPSPAIVLLHGSRRDGAAMLDMAKALAQKGYFLIAPDAANPAEWSSTQDGDDFLTALLEQAEGVHPLERERIYLIGHSAGGNFALWLANRSGGPWRAVAVHAGAVGSGDIAARADAPPVLMVVGERDEFYPVDAVRSSAKALAAAGHDVTLQVVPRHDHWFYGIGPRFARHAGAFLAAAD